MSYRFQARAGNVDDLNCHHRSEYPFAPMRVLALALCWILVGSMAPKAAGELRFNQTLVVLPSPEPGAETITASYAFINAGTEPVSFAGMSTSCGCTAAVTEKATYAPGERGEVRAVFTIGNRVGPQRKHITLRTDEPGAEPIVLTLETNIPPLLHVEPRVVTWAPGETAASKKVRVRVMREEPLFLSVAPRKDETEPNFPGWLTEVEAGRVYELTVWRRTRERGIDQEEIALQAVLGAPELARRIALVKIKLVGDEGTTGPISPGVQ